MKHPQNNMKWTQLDQNESFGCMTPNMIMVIFGAPATKITITTVR